MSHERICSTCLSYMYNHKLSGWLKCPSCGLMNKEGKSMISMEEILMGRAKFEELDPQLMLNGYALLKAVNLFRTEYGIPMIVTSGYRPDAINKEAKGANNSAHKLLEACDFKDEDGKLFEFIKKDPAILDRCGLWMEDPRWTSNWVHLQVRPASVRIFLPYSDGRPATAPDRLISLA